MSGTKNDRISQRIDDETLATRAALEKAAAKARKTLKEPREDIMDLLTRSPSFTSRKERDEE